MSISSRTWSSVQPRPVTGSFAASMSAIRAPWPVSACSRRISSTSRVKISRSRLINRLRLIGSQDGSISESVPCLNITSITLSTTSLSTGAWGRTSKPKSERLSVTRVSRSVSVTRSTGSPSRAFSSQASSISWVACTTLGPIAATAPRRKTGCMVRRCERQSSPSVVSRPSPITVRNCSYRVPRT